MPIVSGGGGGGGTPFNGGTIANPLTINTATTDKLNLDNGSAVRSGVLAASSTGTRLYNDPDGVGAPGLELNTSGFVRPGAALLDENFDVALEASLGVLTLGVGGPIAIKGGALHIVNNSAPTDGSIPNGQCALWFDSTDGAAKLMVKAKSANGTVVAAAIALA